MAQQTPLPQPPAPSLPARGLPARGLPEVERILFADPVWAAYAIADLQPEMAGDCRWLTAGGPAGRAEGEAEGRTEGRAEGRAEGEALALIYGGLQPPILLTVGDAGTLAALLEHSRAELPPAVYASIRDEHLPVVSRYYDLAADLRPMWRMVLAGAQAALPPAGGAPGGASHPTRLSGAQTADVLRLLAHGGPFSPDAFSPAQIDQGVFFGLYEGADLLAVGGTHIVDRSASIAAIGNMYTHPAARRRGCAAAILRAIVGELLRQEFDTIVLNVDQRNSGAQALYRAHGFVMHTPYIEGKGTLYA